MTTYAQAACERLTKESNTLKAADRKVQVMAAPVCEKLLSFCRQDEEFAQAVVQGGSFADCMAAVAKGAGSAISDIDAFTKAAGFYFKGCKIRVEMTIDLIGDAAGAPEGKQKPVVLDLTDFL